MSAQPWGIALGCFVAGSLAATTVYLRCNPDGPTLTGEGEANGATLTATRVAEVTGP